MTEPVLRHAARVVVLAPCGAVLLVRVRNPDTGHAWWICPGGGLEDGETHAQAAARELAEETGLRVAARDVGPCVWTREHVFPWRGTTWRQRERYHLLRVAARFVPSPALGADGLAAEGLDAMRWWAPGEFARADVEFAPRRLPALLDALVRDGPAADPPDAGV